MACDDRQISQAQREAGYSQQRAGVVQALRPFSGAPTLENLLDYLNRELVPAVRATRNATNDVYLQVADNAPSANPLAYYFSTDTAASDPTTGRIKLNASPQDTATIIRVSESNARLQSVIPWLDVMSGGPTTPLGTVTLVDAVNPGRFLRFDLNTMTDQGAYWDLGVTYIEGSHDDPFVQDEAVVLGFISGVSAAGSTVPVGSISPIARDTFLGNIGTTTAAPVAVPLADVDSTSIVYDGTSHTFQRAALTGFATATQNSNATSSAEPIVTYSASANMSAERVLTSSTSNTVSVAVANQILVESAAITGAIAIAANGTASAFAGIRDNGAAENDRTNLNLVSSNDITLTVTDDAANDELEITATLAAGSTQSEGTGGNNVTLNASTKVLEITANCTVTGFARSGGNVTGDRFWLRCNNGIECELASQDGGSSAGNQISCPYNENMVVPGRGMIEFRYETTWRAISTGIRSLVARHTRQTSDASFSITPSSETTWLRIRGVAAGGGGGGADAGAEESAAGGGGGAGAFFDIILPVSSGNITGAVGAGGAGGDTSGSSGSAGGDTTVTYDGTTYTAGGGSGGTGIPDGSGAHDTVQFVAISAQGPGGTLSALPTGSLGSDGGDGFPGMMYALSEALADHAAAGGNGGASYYGGSGRGGSIAAASAGVAGTAGKAPGSGGGGAARVASGSGTTGAAGGAGESGTLMVEEWRGVPPDLGTIS